MIIYFFSIIKTVGSHSFLIKNRTMHVLHFRMIQEFMALSRFCNKYGFRNNPEFGNDQKVNSFTARELLGK